MPLVLIEAPKAEPVLLAEVKQFMRVDDTADDGVIQSLVAAAVQHLDGRDGWLGRAFMPQTWELRLGCFPGGDDAMPWLSWSRQVCIEVPLSPLASVTSIKYLDATTGTETTLATSEYTVITGDEPGRIEPAYGKVWPSARDVSEAVKVRFVAGYAKPGDIPKPLTLGIKALVAHWYENREAVSPSALAPVPMHVESLLAPFRIWSVCA